MYTFPPTPLLGPTVAKAVEDRALCILVLPVAVLTPYWGKLLASPVLPHMAPYADGFLRIRDPALLLLLPCHCVPSELAVFACNFELLAPRSGLPALRLSPCNGASARRQRPLCGSACDSHNQHRLQEALLAQRGGIQQQGSGTMAEA
jgi:hypothetical protein